MPKSIPIAIDPNVLHRAIAYPYWNAALASVNDHQIRMSVMTEPFGWHYHPDSDEAFLVLDGALVITFKEGDVILSVGEMITVPAGTPHKTRPQGARSVNLTFERAGAETRSVAPKRD